MQRSQFTLRLLRFYRPFRKELAVIAGILLAMQLLSLSFPYFLGRVVNAVLKERPPSEVMLLASAWFLLTLARAALNYFRGRYEVEAIRWPLREYASTQTLDSVFALSMGQHRGRHSGFVQAVVASGEHALSEFANAMINGGLPMLLETTLTTGALLYVDWRLGLVTAAGVFLFVLVSMILNRKFHAGMMQARQMEHENKKVHAELLQNLELIQIYAQEERIKSHYQRLLRKLAALDQKVDRDYSRVSLGRNLVLNLAAFTVIGLSQLAVHRGRLDPGSMVVCIMWARSAIDSLWGVAGFQRQVVEKASAIRKYFEVVDLRPSVRIADNPVQLKIRGDIMFREVSLSYPADESGLRQGDAVAGINFHISPGETVAFVGHSGAGKSTLVNLLLRAYDPTQGEVRVDGEDLRNVDLAFFRRQIGLVQEEVGLFDASLRYNVCFGLNGHKREVTAERLEEIARLACLDRFLVRLPKGWETKIGERGTRLSGGERQRVGLARALIMDSKILILDEATSNLDAVNEALIRKSIKAAAQGRTTIIIAHRLSTVRDADRIFVLHEGRIVGVGSHEQLLVSCEAYQALIRSQMLN